jgi:hypothetical protein
MMVWSDEMLRLDTATLTKVLKLGAKIQKLIRGDAVTVVAKKSAKTEQST